MRTTLILEPEIEKLVSSLASQKRLSRFVNQCIKEHLEREAKERVKKGLASAYRRANKEGSFLTDDFEPVDRQGWPEW
ncbi:hypothetical protein KKG61_01540 [bacterium]|nr:hypothetical protein [bacterium]MBU1598782.1 hypothetical protein [bacterium]MBU2461280.1 hypothetical protein [bacterium]